MSSASGTSSAPATTGATHRPLTVAALLLSMFMAAMEATVVGTAMPTVVADLGGLALYGWVGAAYMLASTVSVPVYGKIADLHGRKRVYVFGIALFLAGSLGSGAARTMGELIAARVIQGLGAGAMQPIALTIVGDIFTIEERGRIQGFFGAVWGVAGVVGPLLGGLIVHSFSWPWVFWINLPFGLASIAVVWRYFHEEKQKNGEAPLDWLGASLLTAGASLVLLGATGEHPLLTLPGGAAMIAAFAWVERRAADPVLPLGMVLDRAIGVATLSGLLLGAAMMGILMFVPLYAQGVLGRTPTESGAAVTPMLVGWPLASAVTSRLLVRTGFRAPVVLGSLVVTVSLAAFAALLSPEAPLFTVQLVMFVYGVGMGLANTALLIAVQASVPWNRRGVATATSMFSRSMGGALGAGVLGSLLAARLGTSLSPEKVTALLDPHDRASGVVEVGADMIALLAGALGPLFWGLAVVAVLNLVAVAFYPADVERAPT